MNACNSMGYTAIHVASKYGHINILRLLLDEGAIINVRTYTDHYMPIHLACMYQKVPIVKELLKCGNCDVDETDSKGNTALFYACCQNDAKLTEILVNEGAKTDIKNKSGKTPFNVAESNLCYGVLEVLKSHVDGKNIKTNINSNSL